MSKEAFDRKMEALEALRSTGASETTTEQLRKALKDRNNYLVSKAAAVTGEMGLQPLIPDLIAAFPRHQHVVETALPSLQRFFDWMYSIESLHLSSLGLPGPRIAVPRGNRAVQAPCRTLPI